MNLRLRPYQETIVADLRRAYREGSRAVLLTSPTGSGKTAVFSFITEGAAKRGNRVTILVHRQELVSQCSSALESLGVPHGVIAPGRTATYDPVQVASVQTLVRRLQRTPAPNMIIIDEAHHTTAGSWRKVVEHYPHSLILGVTATPVRLDGQGLGIATGGYYDRLVLGPSVRELIDQGYLTRPVVYAPPVGADMAGVHRRFGDFVASEVLERMDKPTITGNAVEHYLRICPNAPAIAFCVSVRHAEHMAERFRDAGISSESLDGNMDDRMRRHRIMALADGRIRVLTSCDIVSEGTDIPVVTTAILLRPTQSTGLYLQQCGRVLRPFPGKTHSIILDHVGNVFRHGFPDLDRVWTLDGEDIDKRPKLAGETNTNVQCEQCYLVFPAWLSQCPACGWERDRGREVQEVAGELEKIEQIRREEAERFEKKRLISDARTLDELIAVGKRLGYKSGWAQYVWKARLGRRGATREEERCAV